MAEKARKWPEINMIHWPKIHVNGRKTTSRWPKIHVEMAENQRKMAENQRITLLKETIRKATKWPKIHVKMAEN